MPGRSAAARSTASPASRRKASIALSWKRCSSKTWPTPPASSKEAGIRLIVEPINTRDIPGFFLNHSSQALALIERVGSDNLQLQYDIYHMQIMEGDLARTIEANLGRIAHIQIADNPGRNEPGTGEINFSYLFEHIDRIGYAGWIGAEYRPKAGTEAGLGWFREYAGKGSAAA